MNAAALRTALSRYGMIAAILVLGAIVLFEARRSTAVPPPPAPVPAAPAGAPAASAAEMAAVRTFLPSGETAYHVDVATFGGRQLVFGGTKQPVLAVPPGSAVTFRGWAVDLKHKALGRGIELLLDGKTRVAGSTGGSRPDVASALGAPALTNAGFAVTVPPTLLRPGRHTASLLILDSAGTAFYQAKDVIRIDVR
ncbi:MAG: hypothetical protein QOI11_3905 [Candidatus Eremiobacteraeota bacterium]|jgi:hypothetical protein|nr:hypothetical protein [Candidatus Eremiobacteraeota bacterium]